MSVEEHKKIRPILDQILGHDGSWTKKEVKDSVKDFFSNAPKLETPEMKQTLDNMQNTCDKYSGWGWSASEKCTECEKLNYCEASKSSKFFLSKCDCAFDEERAESELKAKLPKSSKKVVLRVRFDEEKSSLELFSCFLLISCFLCYLLPLVTLTHFFTHNHT